MRKAYTHGHLVKAALLYISHVVLALPSIARPISDGECDLGDIRVKILSSFQYMIAATHIQFGEHQWGPA